MKALLLLPLCLLLCGCDGLPRPREMGDMALLRTLGVDGGEGAFALTASTGPRAKGTQGEEQPGLVLSAGGVSLTAARQELEEQGESRVFSGYVDQLILGEELAGQGGERVLAHLARDRELGLGAWLWVVRGEASAAVNTGGDQGVERRLAALADRAGEDLPLAPRRAGEVYADLMEWGTAYAPLLDLQEETLYPAGYAVWKGKALAGLLEGENARGLELLAGRGEGQLLETVLEGQTLVLEVTNSTLTCRRTEDGLGVTCRVEARLAEYERSPAPEELDRLKSWLEETCASRIMGAVEQLRGWGTDCAGLSARAALVDPEAWLGGSVSGLDRVNVEVKGEVRP